MPLSSSAFVESGSAVDLARRRQQERQLFLRTVVASLLVGQEFDLARGAEPPPEVISELAKVWVRLRARVRLGVQQMQETGWSQESATAVPAAYHAAFEFTDQERDLVIRSVVASEALEGFDISRDVAARLLDQALREPLLDLD